MSGNEAMSKWNGKMPWEEGFWDEKYSDKWDYARDDDSDDDDEEFPIIRTMQRISSHGHGGRRGHRTRTMRMIMRMPNNGLTPINSEQLNSLNPGAHFSPITSSSELPPFHFGGNIGLPTLNNDIGSLLGNLLGQDSSGGGGPPFPISIQRLLPHLGGGVNITIRTSNQPDTE